MSIERDLELHFTRRQLFGLGARGIGVAALSSMFGQSLFAQARPGLPHFAPKAKRVIFLHQSGGPSQLETFDYKPGLAKYQGTQIPDSVRQGQRVAQTMGQASLLIANSVYGFKQHGKSGTWVSDLLPHTAKIVDDIAVIKTMYTDAINHDPAITFIQTGFQQPGRPSMGAWFTYGLGSESQNLPGFAVRLKLLEFRRRLDRLGIIHRLQVQTHGGIVHRDLLGFGRAAGSDHAVIEIGRAHV